METTIEVEDERLSDDFWLIHQTDKTLAFAPLRSKVFSVNPNGINALRSFFNGNANGDVEKFLHENGLTENISLPLARIGKPYRPQGIILSLTTGCNLKCIYCYASATSNGIKISDDLAKSAIDIVTKQAKQEGVNQFHVLFHGGGEALTEWKILKSATEYVESIWGSSAKFSIVTNGTLITPDRADWFKKHKFNFTVSLDGPDDIQNAQRPMINGRGSYNACYNGIRLLRERDIPCAIRATITAENVHRIDEMVKIAAELNCGLKVEPISLIGRGKVGTDAPNVIDFANSFQNARLLAKHLKVNLTCTYLPMLKPKIRYCAADGEMFVMLPDGNVSACSRVTKQDDDLSKVFFIGKVENGQLQVNAEKVENLRKLHVQEFEQCTNCFAKWHCAGGCHNTRLSSNGTMSKEHCDLTRWLLWVELLRKSSKKGGE